MIDLRPYKGISCTLIGLSCFLLSSCALTESEYESALKAPAGYGDLQNAPSSKVAMNTDATQQLDFYKSYNDDKLNAMIERALSHNYDMRSAYLNLRQAEVNLGLARSNLHPTANASISSSLRKDLEHGGSASDSSSGSLSIAYEVDLFGRLDASERASYEEFRASAYDYKAMRLTLIQRTSEYYWNYAYATEALALAKEQLDVSTKRLELIKAMVNYGATDGLEYDQALANHRAVEQTVYQRNYELTAAHNSLATLLGLYADENLQEDITAQALETTKSPKLEVPLPASLLQNRPDLMAYEARVRSAYANVDAATASFYPTFNLNAAVGTGSSESLVRFLTDPIGTLGAAITFPFLNFNELSLQQESAMIESDRARLNFANGFITAVEEVANALNELSYQEQLVQSIASEYTLTKSNYERYLERYRYGSASISDVLDASDSLRSAQNRLLSSKRDLLNASMTLMIALGGDSFTKESIAAATSTTTPSGNGDPAIAPVDNTDPLVIMQEAAEKTAPIEA